MWILNDIEIKLFCRYCGFKTYLDELILSSKSPFHYYNGSAFLDELNIWWSTVGPQYAFNFKHT